jgi:hypothetical protein
MKRTQRTEVECDKLKSAQQLQRGIEFDRPLKLPYGSHDPDC